MIIEQNKILYGKNRIEYLTLKKVLNDSLVMKDKPSGAAGQCLPHKPHGVSVLPASFTVNSIKRHVGTVLLVES